MSWWLWELSPKSTTSCLIIEPIQFNQLVSRFTLPHTQKSVKCNLLLQFLSKRISSCLPIFKVICSANICSDWFPLFPRKLILSNAHCSSWETPHWHWHCTCTKIKISPWIPSEFIHTSFQHWVNPVLLTSTLPLSKTWAYCLVLVHKPMARKFISKWHY